MPSLEFHAVEYLIEIELVQQAERHLARVYAHIATS